MNSVLIWSLIFAVLSPIIFALMNVVDKYIVAHRTKNALGFSALAAIANSIIGIVFALFLNWNGYSFSDFIIPMIVGTLMGTTYFLYFLIIKKEDVSNLTGLVFIYPVLVGFLSFLFLHEVLPLISYLGMILILAGVIMLSVRMKHLKISISLWTIALLVIIVAADEFMIKIFTNTMPELNGIAVNSIFICLPSILGIIFYKKLRVGFISEIKNIRWAFLSELFTFGGIMTLYLAMVGLSATIVSSIAALQPLALLGFERIAQKIFGKMTKDKLILPKLIAIVLIVVGIILIYSTEILNALK
jgi:drug/metabolite transporter (DMT)-like permease